jgi:hemerythrin-like domain-containing protein
MKPIGPLMREHRLIERMIALLSDERIRIKKSGKVDVNFLTSAVDFIRTYADRTHHGKEELILFKSLSDKPLTVEHKRIMQELIDEHVYGRKLVSALVEVTSSYSQEKENVSQVILGLLSKLTSFYPAHIEKEDKHFFYPCLDYLTKQEQDDMLTQFWEFDRSLIHEKYTKVVEELSKNR